MRAAGRVEVDERLLATIAPKFEGYVETLHVNATGQPVAKGQPLFEAYSPELVAAQREYAIAARGKKSLKDAGAESRSGMAQLAESSLTRLRNWDVSDEQIEALEKTGRGAAHRHVPVPGDGHRDGEEGGLRHALHARRDALPGGRPVAASGSSPTCPSRTSAR